MKKTLLNWGSILTLFIGSAMVVINRYSQVEQQEAATTEGLNIIGFALLWFIGIIAISFVVTNIKGYIQQHAFGKVAITVYALVFAFLSYSLWVLVKIIKEGAQANVDTFVANMEYHMHSLWLLMLVAVLALAIAWLDWTLVGLKKLGSWLNEML